MVSSACSGAGGRTNSTAGRRLLVARARRGRVILRSACSPAVSVAPFAAGCASLEAAGAGSVCVSGCVSADAVAFSAFVRRLGARRLRAGGLFVGFVVLDAPFVGAPGAIWAPSSLVFMFLLPLPHGEYAEKRRGTSGREAILSASRLRCVALCQEEWRLARRVHQLTLVENASRIPTRQKQIARLHSTTSSHITRCDSLRNHRRT